MIIFVIDDGNVLEVYDSEAELNGACEGIDAEDGVCRFFDQTGQPLEPEFYKPNKRGKTLFGLINWVESGKYRLVRSRKSGQVNLIEALAAVVAIEKNSYFSTLEDVRGSLTTGSSATANFAAPQPGR